MKPTLVKKSLSLREAKSKANLVPMARAPASPWAHTTSGPVTQDLVLQTSMQASRGSYASRGPDTGYAPSGPAHAPSAAQKGSSRTPMLVSSATHPDSMSTQIGKAARRHIAGDQPPDMARLDISKERLPDRQSKQLSRPSLADKISLSVPTAEKLARIDDPDLRLNFLRPKDRNWPKPVWSNAFSDTLTRHYNHHSHEFKNLTGPYKALNKREYGKLAEEFMHSDRPDTDTLFTFRQKDERIGRYDRKLNLFGIMDSKANFIISFYRPGLRRNYAETTPLQPSAAGEDMVARGALMSATQHNLSARFKVTQRAALQAKKDPKE